jgi:hypothetical protein
VRPLFLFEDRLAARSRPPATDKEELT